MVRFFVLAQLPLNRTEPDHGNTTQGDHRPLIDYSNGETLSDASPRRPASLTYSAVPQRGVDPSTAEKPRSKQYMPRMFCAYYRDRLQRHLDS